MKKISWVWWLAGDGAYAIVSGGLCNDALYSLQRLQDTDELRCEVWV